MGSLQSSPPRSSSQTRFKRHMKHSSFLHIALTVTLNALLATSNQAQISSGPEAGTNTTTILLASNHLKPQLAWARTSPGANHIDGPVLYQLLFRPVNVQPGHLIGVSNSNNFFSSLITDNGTMVAIGGLSINGSTGLISFAPNQVFPAPSGGGFLPLTGGTLTGALGGTSGNFT